ncbi:helix-turn-helix domain-containing protein [Pseudomonas lactis]|uniref:helix-turn-helix domain-containing protein n=1 Tax=Pseudomonas TaxID=286 RepID=UPI000BB62181|nr:MULTISPECIES: helix-turn-helix transcriptional regulator [Pseudomonas]MBA5955836.1 helix-turn-helix domain-containing protein [Pseudomonas lactis]PRW76149.1 XRE family transcriptional regulator [Pseudomonas fluorescens]PRW77931.1 XRE family transcriptional regulator [Pseudomonas fluorescens]
MNKNEDSSSAGYAGFPERLREIVEKQGVRGLSLKSGLSEGVIRKYMNGESYPTLDRLDKLAKAANASLSWLAFGAVEQLDGIVFSPPTEERIGSIGRRLSSMIVLVHMHLVRSHPEYVNHPEVVRYLMSDIPFTDLVSKLYGVFDGRNIWESERYMEEETLDCVQRELLELYEYVIDEKKALPQPRWAYVAPL